MKQNLKKLATAGILTGCLAIGGVGVFAMANGNAYESAKKAVLQTIQSENMTVTTDLNVKQDGKVLMSGNSFVQWDGERQYSNNQITLDNETIDFESASTDTSTVVRKGDQYFKYTDNENGGDDHERSFSQSSSAMKLAEMAADLLIGDVKTHFTGNGNSVKVNLEGAQIPEILNIAASAMIEESAAEADQHASADEFDDLDEKALALISVTKDVQIKRITLDATLKDGCLGDNTMKIVFTGKDDAGKSHEITMQCRANVTNIGSTAPKSIDTTGKTVKHIAED